jgi:hypothetical protein
MGKTKAKPSVVEASATLKIHRERVAKWLWKMAYCKTRGLAPANSKSWDLAEEEWEEARSKGGLPMAKDLRPPRGWWASGEYLNDCHKCRRRFIGDKRAAECADCAYAEVSEPE